MTTSYITVTDQFCGAGGSSIGATHAGAELRLALNHWKLAIETHNSNFPDADHDCTDISACDPRRYASTTMLITSPECTNHSLAKGKARKLQAQLELFGRAEIDPSEERSRATMWDVCRFAEHHHYQIVIVENVVEARWWTPFPAWLHAMELLGYNHKCVYLNSMHHHPTPQSRDRMYVVFWKKSLRAPNLDFRPRAHCPACGGDVQAVQSWKNPKKPWGKYQQQYVFRCPACAAEVVPYYYCAANAIDWSLPAPRIGDRPRPLKDKTRKRIEIGLKKFGRSVQLVGNYSPGWTRPVTQPTGTVTGADHHALLTPPMLANFVQSGSENSRASSVEGPWPTQVGNVHHALVTPPFLVQTSHPYAESEVKTYPADGPIPTQTARQELGVTIPPFLLSVNHSTDRARPITDAAPTAMPQGNPYLVTPPYIVELRGANQPKGVDEALSTMVSSGNHHGLVVPFLTSYNSTSNGSGVQEPIPTQDTRDRHALVLGPVANVSAVDDCGFRMLQPHEIGRAMAFPEDYVVVGNQRQRVKQYGNAVTPPVMRWLVERCLEVLN